MKRLIFIFLICILGNISKSQTLYPTPYQSLGSIGVAVRDTGGLFVRGTFVPPYYSDTTAANSANYVKNYSGSLIYTSDNKAWLRNLTKTKWIEVGAVTPTPNLQAVTTVGNSTNRSIDLINNTVPTSHVVIASDTFGSFKIQSINADSFQTVFIGGLGSRIGSFEFRDVFGKRLMSSEGNGDMALYDADTDKKRYFFDSTTNRAYNYDITTGAVVDTFAYISDITGAVGSLTLPQVTANGSDFSTSSYIDMSGNDYIIDSIGEFNVNADTIKISADSIAFSVNKFVQGDVTVSVGNFSHSEGYGSQSIGDYSHAEGEYTVSNGYISHSEGTATYANGNYSHSEGSGNYANGDHSHAEGGGCIAIGEGSHAEGASTVSKGLYSHAEGSGTISTDSYSHAEGTFNDTTKTNTALVIGNGIDDANRSNILYLSKNGEFQLPYYSTADTNQVAGFDIDGNMVLRTKSTGGSGVSSVATGLGLSGGTITSTGTLLLDTASASVISRQRAAATYQPLSTTWLLTGNSGTTTGANYLGTSGNNGLRIRTNNTTALYIDSLQNLGIGTSSITNYGSGYATLAIGGSTKLGLIDMINNSGTHGLLQNDAGSGGFVMQTTSAVNIAFRPNNATAMTVASGGSVGIGQTSPAASALLDVTSTTKGFLPPRMTTTQRDAISSPAAGLIIYNTTTNKLNVYTTTWEAITSL